jgi:hypothetical protein
MTEAAPPGPFADPLTARIAAFLDGIGIPVLPADLPDRCFLPGIRLDGGKLLVDESRMLCPGDLLHEAGHIAVMTPERRAGRKVDASKNGGDELGAIAWSWAALTHLGLPPEVVFHPQGYRGGSQSLIENFSQGHTLGVPLLQWMGLTLDARAAAERGVPPFPHMLRWLREAPAEA